MAGFSAGSYSRHYDWTDDRDAGVKIRSDRMDEEFDSVATALSTCLLKDGTQTVTANIPMANFKITGLGTPTADGDAATKAYVDDNLVGFPNLTVRLASTANIDLSTALDDGSTVDSVTIATDDLILVKDQTTESQNGIYVVPASGAASRSTSYDAFADYVNLLVSVTAGTVNAGNSFRSTVNSGGTIDVTDITFAAFGTSLTTPISVANGGTGAGTASSARTNLGIDLSLYLLLAGGTLSGNLTLADNQIIRPLIKDYGEIVNAIGSTGGGTQDIDLTLGNVVSATVDTSANTFTFSNPSPTGNACSFTLFLTNGGSQTVNWPASVDWAGGTAPTLTTAGVDILTFVTLNAGTTWYGFLSGQDMS